LIKIAITVEAFEAIARTLPLGKRAFENKIDEMATVSYGSTRRWSTGWEPCRVPERASAM
jgi:hypothetical protein